MRPLLGTTGRAVRRRWSRLDRFLTLSLPRDPYAETPGTAIDVALGERTQLRAAATIVDEFLRTSFGDYYETPVGFDGLTLSASGIVTTATGAAPHLETYAAVLPREQWAEVRILSLASDGARAAVGVGLRWSPPSGSGRGYLILAEQLDTDGTHVITVTRYRAGAPEEIDAFDHPWRVGDVLRAEADYRRVRVYRNGTLIRTTVDADPLLVGGRAAIVALRETAGEAASLTDFLAGPLRHEYVGLIADLGPVTQSLGLLEPTAQPAAWDAGLVNLGPVGGADRLASLLRHGLNNGAGTVDWPRARARVWTELQRGSAPLAVADGLIESLGGMTEDRVRIACRGRDAFLTPAITPGLVTYLPGDDPLITTAPVPVDPCGADAEPVVVPGDPPDEPPVELPGDTPGDPPGTALDPPPSDEEEEEETDDGGGGGGGDEPDPRVTYAVFDVNAETESPVAESDAPTGENVIKIAHRPLQGTDVNAGVETRTVNVYRTGVIGVWAPTTGYTVGQRVRRTASDPIVFQCFTTGTTGGSPPTWDEDKGDFTADGTVNWFSWGGVLPLTSPVPGTHIRLNLSVTIIGASDVQIVKKTAGAPPDLDDTLEAAFNHSIGANTVLHTISSGIGATDFEIEIGDATAITVNPRGASGGEATVSVHKAQFFTPAPP